MMIRAALLFLLLAGAAHAGRPLDVIYNYIEGTGRPVTGGHIVGTSGTETLFGTVLMVNALDLPATGTRFYIGAGMVKTRGFRAEMASSAWERHSRSALAVGIAEEVSSRFDLTASVLIGEHVRPAQVGVLVRLFTVKRLSLAVGLNQAVDVGVGPAHVYDDGGYTSAQARLVFN